MGGLEVLSKCEGFHVGKEDAFWGFSGCSTGGGESEDEEVNVSRELHGSSDNRRLLIAVRQERNPHSYASLFSFSFFSCLII